MKKIIAILAVALISVVSVFAFDLGDIKGTWQDKKWDADWTFSADGKIILTKTSTGEVVYTFTDDNVQNFKLGASADGATVTFTSKENYRSYKFTKPITLSTDLNMVVNPDWSDEDYTTTLTLKK